MAGNKNIKDIMVLIDRAIEQCDASLDDGKISMWDIPNFLKLIPEFKAAVQGIDKIWEEAKDLDKNEYAELGEIASRVITKALKLFGKKKS